MGVPEAATASGATALRGAVEQATSSRQAADKMQENTDQMLQGRASTFVFTTGIHYGKM